ncbi:uncharacterized protein BYT42DRAFT_583308 [Radiomyces spectabilis]|uniref:uncharacterized protein n=1 Tax=Radiomyces spectabilis TaxID=64574 RepID=UPI00221F2C7C|nr:uncharacterized protein BYT42DRAFT_583308 [Radiomyces spectabilis]KAI8370670.1 hypothetical protein BYT42DRAFT_583308 [Radiomyces spectabilis]
MASVNQLNFRVSKRRQGPSPETKDVKPTATKPTSPSAASSSVPRSTLKSIPRSARARSANVRANHSIKQYFAVNKKQTAGPPRVETASTASAVPAGPSSPCETHDPAVADEKNTDKNPFTSSSLEKKRKEVNLTATEQSSNKPGTYDDDEEEVPLVCRVRQSVPMATVLWAQVLEELDNQSITNQLAADTDGCLMKDEREAVHYNASDAPISMASIRRKRKQDHLSTIRRLRPRTSKQNMTIYDYCNEYALDESDSEDEILERPIRRRMSAEETQSFFDHIAQEILCYE